MSEKIDCGGVSVLTQTRQEFEFPAYFTYFVRKFKCTLVVDSPLAEKEIRMVFGETLLGPYHFRDHQAPLANVDEDFDPSFPKDRRPNFYKELGQFRANEKTTDYEELEIDTLVNFVHFSKCRKDDPTSDNLLGVPPETKLVQFGNGSIHIGNESIGIDSSLLLSPLNEASGRGKRTLGPTPPSNGSGKPAVSFPNDRMNDLNTIASISSASESSSRKHVTRRRASLTSLVEPSDHSSLHSSFGMLQRSNSDGSLSRHSLESVNSGSNRRGSMGSLIEKPASARLLNARASWGGQNKLFMSQTIETTPVPAVRMARRRDSTFTNYSSRASTKVSGLSSQIDPYDFMDDDADQQDATWMYSQAKWLGRLQCKGSATHRQKLTSFVSYHYRGCRYGVSFRCI